MIPPAAIVEALFAKGLRRILIEGGARTIATFIEANCLDRMFAVCWWPAPAVSKDRGLLWIGQSRAPSLARAAHEGA
jgi:riboflavin biosynthesis pyrimidine reductase